MPKHTSAVGANTAALYGTSGDSDPEQIEPLTCGSSAAVPKGIRTPCLHLESVLKPSFATCGDELIRALTCGPFAPAVPHAS
jgi:hypothetical protein